MSNLIMTDPDKVREYLERHKEPRMHFDTMLVNPEEVEARFPLTKDQQKVILGTRLDIENIISGQDDRLLAVVGPCSAFPVDSVKEYAEKLIRLQEEVSSEILFVLRCYLQKPRTVGGWTGLINKPDPKLAADINAGIWTSAELMHFLTNMGAPLADEVLFTHGGKYFNRFLSWAAIGARTTEGADHRYVASGLDMPVGLKNGTDGSIETGVNSVRCAQASHTFPFMGHQVTTAGNEFAHLILRGGEAHSNWDPRSLKAANELLMKHNVKHPFIMVDANHANSGKDPRVQEVVLNSLGFGISRGFSQHELVGAVMVESFLKEGNQSENAECFEPGLSITDSCMGWPQTESVFLELANTLAGTKRVPRSTV